jgi:hypothetical protein
MKPGYTIPCSVHGCPQRTGQQTSEIWLTAARAVAAARTLGWIYTRDGRWICPQHQTWDARLGRWTAPEPNRQETR